MEPFSIVPHAHQGVYTDGRDLYTRLLEGAPAGGHRTVDGEDGTVYRSFPPSATKLAAYVKAGGTQWPFRTDSRVLYLGAGAGTTVSFVSDVCPEGSVVAVEFAPEPFRDLVEVARGRPNVIPVLADARDPSSYAVQVGPPVDVVYQDVAQRDQWTIAERNARDLMAGNGTLMLVVKARSVDVTRRAGDVFQDVASQAERAGYPVSGMVDLGAFHEGHAILVIKRR
jgi:fibrillarin-like pre-rRNA processing protein